MEPLQEIQHQFLTGEITSDEFEFRRRSLIDSLTGTSAKPYLPSSSLYSPLSSNTEECRSFHVDVSISEDLNFNKRLPPSFADVSAERAYKFCMDERSGRWSRSEIFIKIESEPFAKGSQRVAFHCLELCDTEKKLNDEGVRCVAKLAIDPLEDKETYFLNAWIQNYAKKFGEKYNLFNPPKKVEFLSAWVLQLIERQGSPLCGVEMYMAGEYRKHNNNFGYVSEAERNTPQAFSHFSYECSGHKILICDIQGVNDLYTDPQVHSVRGNEFGHGDLGQEGFKKFLASHRCNPICRYFRLPTIKENTSDNGTLPSSTYMTFQSFEDIDAQVQLPSKPSSTILSDHGVENISSNRDVYYILGLPGRTANDVPKRENLLRCCMIL
jgi:hypothetical protein